MKKYLLLSLLLIPNFLNAATDRFGNQREEVRRSSYTNSQVLGITIASTTEINTLSISSQTAPITGGIILRSVLFSGGNPSTATFFDNGKLDGFTSTRTHASYWPGPGGAATNVDFNMFFSSGLVLKLECAVFPCPTTIFYDYTTTPLRQNNLNQ